MASYHYISRRQAETVASNGTPEDDPFGYLYRPETVGATQAEQPTHQPTAQFPAFAPDATAAVGSAYDAPAPPGYAGRAGYGQPQAPSYAPSGEPGYGRPAGHGGHGGRGGVALSGRGPLLVAGGLALAAVLGVFAVVGFRGHGDTKNKAAAPGPSVSAAPSASTSPTPAPDRPLRTTAEKLQLTGGAQLATDHDGFTGEGFVAGLDNPGAGLSWTMNVASAGRYRLTVRYANALGTDGQLTERKIGLAANGEQFGQLRMPPTGNWSSWGTTWRTVHLKKGKNEIVVSCNPGDSCHVNIDTMRLNES
jgi:hypothetical protein